jgi:D-alanine transaminase/branched-chain amino acid aminotransferase
MAITNAYVNEAFIPAHEASLPTGDLGIQRGYGIFDFLRIDGTDPLFLTDHLDRFFTSAAYMRLGINHSKGEIEALVHTLVQKNRLQHSGLKLLLTGGDSEDGYTITKPRFSMVQQALMSPPDIISTTGIRLASSDYQRQLPEVKTTDYLMAIWLQQWMQEMGADDILYHQQGQIRECPRSNFFLITQNHTLLTPASGMLKGITRKNILAAANQLGLALEVRDIKLEEIQQAKGAFISSSTKRIMPVHAIDGYTYQIPDALPIMKEIWQELLTMEQACSKG